MGSCFSKSNESIDQKSINKWLKTTKEDKTMYIRKYL